jgi:selenocysteine lyase/cysteine desulfurase
LGGAIEPHAPQMVSCELGPCDPEQLQRRLLDRHSIEVVVREHRKGVALRASFHVYNDSSDVDRLVDALAADL